MTATQTPIHISETFFSKASRYFSGFQSALSEVIQNAHRSYLPRDPGAPPSYLGITVDSDSDGTDITVRDHGCGIQDIGAALSIGISQWDPSVETTQDPAGMGLCAALAYADTVEITSAFGTLEIEGAQFFASAEYRDTLLDKIVPHIDGVAFKGTALTMRGVRAPGINFGNAVCDAVFYYTDLAVSYREVDSATPEQVLPNCASVAHPATWASLDAAPEGSADANDTIAFRGYKLYNSMSMKRTAPHDLGIVWHGQYIYVNLANPALKRTLVLPEGPVDVFPEIPGTYGLCVVIDGGEAPVTPQLPGRDNVVMDAKTVDFIWGLLGPILERRIECARQHYRGLVAQGLDECAPWKVGVHRRGSAPRVLQMVPAVACRALYNFYIGRPVVAYPMASRQGAMDYSDYLDVLGDPKGLPDVLVNAVIFRTQDGDFLTVGGDGETEDIYARFMFPRLTRAGEAASKGCRTDLWRLIPNGVCLKITEGLYSGVLNHNYAVMVVEIPYTTRALKDLADPGTRIRAPRFMDVPVVKGEVWVLEAGTSTDDLIDDLFRGGTTEVLTSRDYDAIQDVVLEERPFEIPSFGFYAGDTDLNPDEAIVMGPPAAAVALIDDLEECFEVDGFSNCDDPSAVAADIKEAFIHVRQNIQDVIEIQGPLHDLLCRVGMPNYREQEDVTAVRIDRTNKTLEITKKDGTTITKATA